MNLLTIDIEEIFHAELVKKHYMRALDYRTPKNLPIILDMLDLHDAKATFFVVGEIAERFHEIIEMIEERGHEVAFHGWTHAPLWESDEESFRKDVASFRRICPDCTGYRAPTFSLNNDTKWAIKILKSEGFVFDSSIFPVWIPRYGVHNAPYGPYKPSVEDISKDGNKNFGILEFPLATHHFLGPRFPIAGGFWLRFWNIGLTGRWIRKLNKDGVPAVIYVHNWELDPRTPRLRLNLYNSFVTYHNLAGVTDRLRYLLRKSRFTSVIEYMEMMRLS